jgi:hypothetical protein
MEGLTPMMALVIGFVWILNLGISFWNARACGLAWIETKVVGGWYRFMVWMGAIMAAVGFTWCALLPISIGAFYFQYINAEQFKIAIEIGYVIIIPFALFSGYAIMIDSWAQAFRSGKVMDYGVAVYNTAANLHNTYDAWQSFGPAVGDIFNFFSGSGSSKKKSSSSDDDDKGAGGMIVVAIVVLSLAIGIIATVAIIRSYAGSRPQELPEVYNYKH